MPENHARRKNMKPKNIHAVYTAIKASGDMAELNPWLWPLAGKKRTVRQLDSLLERLSYR